MFSHVTNVRHIEAYKLEVSFDDGATKEVNLEAELYGEVSEPLKDIEFFKQVKVNEETNTIEWPNGADFAPEFLHDVGKDVKQSGSDTICLYVPSSEQRLEDEIRSD